MVPVGLFDVNDRLQTVRQSVDYAIRDLVRTGKDPLALSVYLWVVQRNGLTLVNSDILANWGSNWLREVLIEQRIGPQADVEVASAALAAVSLRDTASIVEIECALRERLSTILSEELDKSPVPFRRPTYAAILLLAALVFGVQDKRIRASLKVVHRAFMDSAPGGRLFGIGALASTLSEANDSEALAELSEAGLTAIHDARVGYENQAYAAEALCIVASGRETVSSIYDALLGVVERSPVWSHLLVGQEDVPEVGDRRSVVHVSHLYRAALLNVALYLEHESRSRLGQELDKRYRGRRWVTIAAFLFFVVVVGGVWWMFFSFLQPRTEAAKQFWLLQHYQSASLTDALAFLGGVLAASFVLPASVLALWTLSPILLYSASESEGRIVDAFRPRLSAYTRGWLVVVGIATVVGLLVTVIGPGVVHLLGQ